MLLLMIVLAFEAKCTEQTDIILSPKFSDLLENDTLELTCFDPVHAKYTQWKNHFSSKTFLILRFAKEEGSCDTEGFLADVRYFKTKCYSKTTFKVIIKRMNISNHGQEWFCEHRFTNSNPAFIKVQVPTKYVKFKNVLGDVLKVVEKMKTIITCETSEGHPTAYVTWTKISKEGIWIDVTHDISVSIEETLTKRNMTLVRSSIDIEPVREDNGTRIICEATNRKSYVVRKEITIHVQYPTGKPYFQFIGQNEFMDNVTFLEYKISVKESSSFTVICKADGYPLPTCTWNVEGHRDINSSSLTFTNISRDAIGLYRCFTENVLIKGFSADNIWTNTSSDLEIDVQYQSKVVMFYINGFEQTARDVFEVTENATIIFNCSVDRNPESSMTLSFRGQEVLNHTLSGNALIHTIRLVSCFDDGVYKCPAQNKYNIKPSVRELRLRVTCRPRLSPEFKLTSTRHTVLNSTVTFKFEAIANPMPTFKWFKWSGPFWHSLSISIKYKILTSGLSSSLSIRNITEDDYGYCKVKIANDVGSVEQFYILKANDTIDAQGVDPKESSIPRLLVFSVVGIIGFAITAAVVVFFGQRHRRQEESGGKQSVEVNDNQTTTSNTDNITLYDEIGNVYEHLEEQMKERTTYMEMQTIETEDSNKDYITPII